MVRSEKEISDTIIDLEEKIKQTKLFTPSKAAYNKLNTLRQTQLTLEWVLDLTRKLPI